MKKVIITLFITVFILILGCGQTKYVCQDGSEVSDSSLCVEKESNTEKVVVDEQKEVEEIKEEQKVEEKEVPQEKIYSLNEDIKVDYLIYNVKKVETFTKMGSSMFEEETKGKFIKIYLEILNDAKESKNIWSPRFKIMDSQERKYDEFPSYSMYIADGLDWGAQLQPGLSVEGAVVFELPKDSEDLILIISGDWISVKEVKIKLSDITDIGTDTTSQDESDAMMDEMMNACNAPFKCTSTCSEYMDAGQKDCPEGQVCCME